MNYILYIFGLLLISYNSFAIVNIESIRNQKTNQQFETNILLSADRITGNSKKSSAKFSLQFRAQEETYEHLLLGAANYGESNNVKDVNKSLMHYRFAWDIQRVVSYETFLQTEKNEFTKLILRQLYGVGLRFRLFNENYFYSFLGTGVMHENEAQNINNEDVKQSNLRANIYLSLSAQAFENVRFVNVSYFQPNLENQDDYKMFVESQLEFKVNNYLKVILEHSLAYDNQPVTNIEKADHTYGTSFKFIF